MAGLGGPSKPGAAARPVGIYDPYDADGCADCACHGKALCEVRLSVAREMKQPLMLQFQLEAFYQNHRRYLNSVSHAQLSRSSLEQQSSALDYEVPPPRPACRTRLAPAPHPLRNRSAPAPHPLRTRRAAARAAAAHPRAPLPPERTRARARALWSPRPPRGRRISPTTAHRWSHPTAAAPRGPTTRAASRRRPSSTTMCSSSHAWHADTAIGLVGRLLATLAPPAAATAATAGSLCLPALWRSGCAAQRPIGDRGTVASLGQSRRL